MKSSTWKKGGKMQVPESQFTSISIPVELAKKIKKRIEGSGFTSMSSYVTFVLREILGIEGDEARIAETRPLSEKERVELFKRLKNLGYI